MTPPENNDAMPVISSADGDGVLEAEVPRERSPPGWAEAFARAADLVVGEAATADDVLRDYGRLATIVVEEFPPSPEREALLERLAEREALALIAVGALRTH